MTDASGTTTVQYIYDGDNLLAVLNVASDGTATVEKRFLMGSGENQILAQENAGSNSSAGPVSWALTDNTGSVVDVVQNGSGNTVLAHIVYDSFGNITAGTDPMLMGYQGYIQDASTGLDYANARYYDPSLGRFISQDPTGFAAGDSNLYRFVDNHPTYATDPTGLYDGGSTSTQSSGSYQSSFSSITAPTSSSSYLAAMPSGNSVSAPISLTSGGGSYASFSSITAPTSSTGNSGINYAALVANAVSSGSYGGLGGGSYVTGSNSIALNPGNGGSSSSPISLASSPSTAASSQFGAPPMEPVANPITPASTVTTSVGQWFSAAWNFVSGQNTEQIVASGAVVGLAAYNSWQQNAWPEPAWLKGIEKSPVFMLVSPEGDVGAAGEAAWNTAKTLLGAESSAVQSETTLQQLQGAASRAAQNVGEGSGPVYGTALHSAFKTEIGALGKSDLFTEQSYLNGRPVDYGTPGSIRIDLGEGTVNSPTSVYDLKTGRAVLTPARIQQIQLHLPSGSTVPVYEVRP